MLGKDHPSYLDMLATLRAVVFRTVARRVVALRVADRLFLGCLVFEDLVFFDGIFKSPCVSVVDEVIPSLVQNQLYYPAYC